MLPISENLICTVNMGVMHVKKQNVATACDVLPKVGKDVSSTRDCLCVELSHQVTNQRAKDHGDFHCRQRDTVAGRF